MATARRRVPGVSDGDRTRDRPDHNRERYRCATLTIAAILWPLVPAPGLEPGRREGHPALNWARLPFPPGGHVHRGRDSNPRRTA